MTDPRKAKAGEQAGYSQNSDNWNGSSHHPTPDAASARDLARVAITAARGQLDRYALEIDDPEAGIPEVADLLDAALAAMSALGVTSSIYRGH